MRAARKKSLMSIIGFMVVCCFYTLAYSKAPATIKVGLESVYKNAASVSLSSDVNIQIGYYDETGFEVEGVLNASQITIRLNKESYYDLEILMKQNSLLQIMEMVQYQFILSHTHMVYIH